MTERGGIGHVVAAFGSLEWAFTIFVATLTGLAGLFGLYVLIQQFRNPFRR